MPGSQDDPQPPEAPDERLDPPALSTGWEADLPADDSVVRQFVVALAARLEHEAGLAGGWADRDDLAVVADVGSPVPFENGIVLLRPPDAGELEALTRRCFDRFLPDRQWVLYSAFPLPDLTSAGFTRVGHPPFMYRPAGGAPRPAPPELDVHPVGDETDLASFSEVMLEGFGFGLPPGTAAFAPALLDGGPRFWLGRVEGRPVAASAGNVIHGINEVAMVATHPDARGRGYGEALTWSATLTDPALPAGLIASDDGQPTYERMGYLRVLRFTLWGAFGE